MFGRLIANRLLEQKKKIFVRAVHMYLCKYAHVKSLLQIYHLKVQFLTKISAS